MSASTSSRWTIAELGARAAEALSVDYRGPENGQIRAIPNQRTIRYYTTLGLLDRPAEMHGRTAYYGPRHLMQVVAIKRMQAAGKTLEEVQGELAGLPDSALAAIARIPAAISDGRDTDEPAPPGRRAQRFWAAAPAPLPSAKPERASGGTASEHGAATAAHPSRRDGVRAMAWIELATGVSVLVEPARAPSDEDVAALRSAAAGLVDELVARGLIEGAGPGGNEPGGSR